MSDNQADALIAAIEAEAPAREPSDRPTVGFQPSRDPEVDDGNEVVREAFDEGRARGLWEAVQLARQAAKSQVTDWWRPDPDDPFWMLEAEDGEWLKNAHSMLGTRDPSKAIRFPTERDAYNHPARMKAGYKWWAAKPTEHLWIQNQPV